MTRVSNTVRAKVFGPPCTPRNYETVTTPWGVRCTVHKLVKARFLAACGEAHRTVKWVPRRIDSYVCRTIRGSNTVSIHSWALAWDFFDTPPGAQPDVWGPLNAPSPEFRAVFKRWGFYCGADYEGRKDYPHIEWASGMPDPVTGQQQPAPARPVTRTVTEFPEEQMRRHDFTVPQLDDKGNGWVVLPGTDAMKVVSVVQRGAFPPDDGYWNLAAFGRQQRGPDTVVQISEADPAHLEFSVWVAD